MTATSPAPADAAGPSSSSGLDPHLLRTAFAIIAGGIAVIFDSTIVSVAIRDLGRELNSGVSQIQWVSTGYLLAMFVAIPATGWLQSRLGGKHLWIWAQILFGLGSVLCACAWDTPSLVAFRVVQGLGGGVMMPLMITLLMQASQGQPLGRVMAVIGLPISLGPILGPVLGGVILHFGSWHWLFLVNIPFVIVGVTAAIKVLNHDRPAPGTGRAFDWLGFCLMAPGTVGVIYGLANVSEDGGLSRTDVWPFLLVGAILLAAFVPWAISRGDRALIDVKLFRHRPLAVGGALMFLMGFVLYGSMFLMPLFFQTLDGATPLRAGLLLVPQGVGTLLSRRIGGHWTDTIGPRMVAMVGFAIAMVGTIPFAFSDGDTAQWLLMAVLLVRGFGLGMVMTPIMAVAYNGLERHEMPDASILTRVTQQLGGSFGTAVLATILSGSMASASGPSDIAAGFQEAFWWAIGFTAVATVLAVVLPKRPLPL
ncbi:MDR family MFS transporter [Nocardioides sp.]|uniref:MDR family MFS transporter n=1 Tax=Nocardioides sp. TaxID=35761 RepID=UPI00262FD95F|nr:MDR family MFS transporter [Nocardioides sp.]